MIRILLIDDHASTREPLAFMLEQEADLTVIAQAGSIAEARRAIERLGGEVDIAIVDLGLPDGSGEELIPGMHQVNRNAEALVLTYYSDRDRLALAVQAGASGVLHKSASFEAVVDAIRLLYAGEQLLSLETVLHALRFAGEDRRSDESPFPLEKLTAREMDVLQGLADGLSDREIADRLFVGPSTIHTHVMNILAKLDATSRLQALVVAVRYDLVTIA
jgi:DNA-binding NarL/FixJ family response regulator